jgi:hypothetical protein
MNSSHERLEKLFEAASRVAPPPVGEPSAASEAVVLRAWRQRATARDEGADSFALFRHATFTALGVCAGCAVWSLLAAAPAPAAASPVGLAGLAGYALNLSWTP